jgi:hypothetical protein
VSKLSGSVTLLRASLCALAIVFVTPSSPAEAAGGPQIGDTRVERAPIGQKGGLMNPVVWCPSGANPRVRTVVEGITNDFNEVWKYRGSLPGLYFPRVQVGRYQLSTQASCGQNTAKRIEVVRVREKTARTTISLAEFRRIRHGMTRARVTNIVGYDGRGSRYGARMYRTYDMMPFWRYTGVEFRNGRVVRKSWNFSHD